MIKCGLFKEKCRKKYNNSTFQYYYSVKSENATVITVVILRGGLVDGDASLLCLNILAHC